jgi:hypothetical protein
MTRQPDLFTVTFAVIRWSPDAICSGRDLVFADHGIRAGSCLGSNHTVGIFCSQRSDKSRVGTGPKKPSIASPFIPAEAQGEWKRVGSTVDQLKLTI